MKQDTIDTIKGILRLLFALAIALGLNISPDLQNQILTFAGLAWGLAEMIVGWFSGKK